MANADPRQVVKVLSEYYSTSELKSLCFDIGIDYEDLGGQGKAGKARELVQFAQRRGRLGEVVAYIQKTRSHVNLAGDSATAPANDNDGNNAKEAAPTIVYNVQGDLIQGDNVGGDNIDGDQITVGNISDSSGVAIGREASAAVNTGDTFNMSGDFRGANVNVKSTLTNVRQTIGTLPKADDTAKAELQKLIAQLNAALQQAPADKAEEADAVVQMTEALIETADSEKPNKMMMQITGDGLKKAAANLAGIVPDVVKITGSIVMGILALA